MKCCVTNEHFRNTTPLSRDSTIQTCVPEENVHVIQGTRACLAQVCQAASGWYCTCIKLLKMYVWLCALHIDYIDGVVCFLKFPYICRSIITKYHCLHQILLYSHQHLLPTSSALHHDGHSDLPYTMELY